MSEYRQTKNALPPAQLEALKAALLGSPFVASSQLNGAFVTSRGFGVAFTAEGRARVENELPAVRPFFALAIDALPESRLQSFWQHERVPTPNAWYMNLLLVGTAGGVAPHVDATLSRAAGDATATPRVVSVLYLQVPGCGGGELVLGREKKLKGVIHPKVGTLLHFRGDLTHCLLYTSRCV